MCVRREWMWGEVGWSEKLHERYWEEGHVDVLHQLFVVSEAAHDVEDLQMPREHCLLFQKWIRTYIRVWDFREQSQFLDNIMRFSSKFFQCRCWFDSNPLCSICPHSCNGRVWAFFDNLIMRLRLRIYLVGLDLLCRKLWLLTVYVICTMSVWTVHIVLLHLARLWTIVSYRLGLT